MGDLSLETARFCLVIDLEATTSDDRSLPKHEMETIEIGAVLVELASLATADEHQTFVRPVRHPRLLPFCTELTRITQAMVDGAPGFPEALRATCERLVWPHPGQTVFGSWGDYDDRQLRQDCAYHRIPFPLPPHVNLKRRFSEALGLPKKLGMADALAHVGLPLIGTHHRGIDDARNIARLLPWILGRAR